MIAVLKQLRHFQPTKDRRTGELRPFEDTVGVAVAVELAVGVGVRLAVPGKVGVGVGVSGDVEGAVLEAVSLKAGV